MNTWRKLKVRKDFDPCPIEAGDEAFANGIFVFNITRLLRFIDSNPDLFPIEEIALAALPTGSGAHLDKATIDTADPSRPVLLAEISPGQFNLIDGHHRAAKAGRLRMTTLPARRIYCPDHVAFLANRHAYETYVSYWNEKLKQRMRSTPRGFVGNGQSI